VRRFETPTALSDGRAQAKKDIPMLKHTVCFMYNPEAKRRAHLLDWKLDRARGCPSYHVWVEKERIGEAII